MKVMETYQSDPLVAEYQDQQQILNAAELNQEPSPTFDIEINQEDKDKDVENPAIHKDSEKDNAELESPDPDKK